jgi:hypothetical protein
LKDDNIAVKLTFRKCRCLRGVTAYDVPPSGGQSGRGQFP